MGFFSACFGRCSNRYRKIGRHEVLDQKTESTRGAQIADHLKIVEERVGNNEDQLNSSARKSIGFDDLNLIIHEEEAAGGSQIEECANQVAAGEKDKGSVSLLQEVLYSEEKADGEQGKNQLNFQKENPEEEKKTEGNEGKKQAKEISDSSKKGEEEEEETGKGEIKWGKQGRDEILSDSSDSSLFTYPPNNRYRNCAGSDDECEDLVDEEVVSSYEVKERHAESDGGPMIQEESSESLFSLSIDSRRRESFTPGTEGDKEVSSSPFIIPSDDNKPMNVESRGTGTTTRDRTQYIDSVLNPIENLSQWKIVRRKVTTTMKNEEQENVTNDSEEFTMAFYEKTTNRCRDDVNVIAVDTSLSSWLVESENNPVQENSPSGSVGTSSLKDRPILGALTLDELKQLSRHSSPRRRSPRFNPDEKPILGTVGSYWRHTGGGQLSMDAAVSGSTMSGHCRRGKINIQTNTFQTRLEEAMDRVE